MDPADPLSDGHQRRPITLEGVDPLLLGFLGAKDSATTPYSLPGTQAMQERGWDDCATGLDTLLSGGTAEEAVEAY